MMIVGNDQFLLGGAHVAKGEQGVVYVETRRFLWKDIG